VIERLNDPLIHLIRNAVDHGIEDPESRAAAGKPPMGRITLAATHVAAGVIISVSDDGRGLDRERIRARAEENGLWAAGARLTDNELFQAIFQPGFSTAREVTSLSGRGVGMDVVKRTIDALRGHGFRDIKYAADAAQALKPLAGDYAYILFAVGLFNASLFAASILPLSTAYTVCEGLGFESGVGLKFGEAPIFYWLYTLLIIAGGALVLVIPAQRLVEIVLWSQVLNGVVLPFVLIFMLLLINKKELMGEYTNTRLFNLIAWGTTAVVIALSLAWMFASVKGGS
jgi:hypothetical protein